MREGRFSTQFRVRYAEIDGQQIVFNARYLEYADLAITEFWDWTGIEQALGDVWNRTDFHVRKAEVDYRKPFVWRDTVEARVAIERLGTSSMTLRIELFHPATGVLHTVITLVSVNVHLPSGRPEPIPAAIRAFLTA